MKSKPIFLKYISAIWKQWSVSSAAVIALVLDRIIPWIQPDPVLSKLSWLIFLFVLFYIHYHAWLEQVNLATGVHDTKEESGWEGLTLFLSYIGQIFERQSLSFAVCFLAIACWPRDLLSTFTSQLLFVETLLAAQFLVWSEQEERFMKAEVRPIEYKDENGVRCYKCKRCTSAELKTIESSGNGSSVKCCPVCGKKYPISPGFQYIK